MTMKAINSYSESQIKLYTSNRLKKKKKIVPDLKSELLPGWKTLKCCRGHSMPCSLRSSQSLISLYKWWQKVFTATWTLMSIVYDRLQRPDGGKERERESEREVKPGELTLFCWGQKLNIWGPTLPARRRSTGSACRTALAPSVWIRVAVCVGREESRCCVWQSKQIRNIWFQQEHDRTMYLLQRSHRNMEIY